MTIRTEQISKTSLELYLGGRLDAATAPQLERKIKQWGEEITEVVLDFSELTYISSMGLRILLQTYKLMTEKKGKLVIRNLGSSIREVFEMSGFVSLLVQEETFVVIKKEEGDRIRLCLIGQLFPTDVSILTKELNLLRDANIARDDVVTIVLDMDKLSYISVEAWELLKRGIGDSVWKNRRLGVENPSDEVYKVLWDAGIGNLLIASEKSNPPRLW